MGGLLDVESAASGAEGGVMEAKVEVTGFADGLDRSLEGERL